MNRKCYSPESLRSLARAKIFTAKEADELADKADRAKELLDGRAMASPIYIDWPNREVRANGYVKTTPTENVIKLLDEGFELEGHWGSAGQFLLVYRIESHD